MLKTFFLVCLTGNALVGSLPLETSPIEEHIVGGNVTDISETPYQVALYFDKMARCGGTIISPTHILTAGHCIDQLGDTDAYIRAGSTSVKKGGVVIKTKKVHHYPPFNISVYDNDVGVIELLTPLPINNKTIKVIKMATKEPSPGSLALISGWGITKENGQAPELLRSVVVPIVDRKICEKAYKSLNIPINQRMICAGVEGKSVCDGDSGGPIVYKNELVGITSFSQGCGRKEYPAVYTNVANDEMSKFIRSIVKV